MGEKSLLSISERSDIAPWLVVLTSNATIDFIRKKKREESFLCNTLISKTTPLDEKAEIFLEENKSFLDEAIGFLSEKEKVYLQLNYMAKKKYKEIAALFGVSINTVSTIIARAKNKIKKYIILQRKKLERK
jgi:RNA polymerase sigma factor (sigma-70 family)